MWQAKKNEALKVVGFNLACCLIALDISSLSVGLFGPPLLLSHMLLGLMVSVTNMSDKDDLVRVDVDIGHPASRAGLSPKYP
jgi:hypothetical protein